MLPVGGSNPAAVLISTNIIGLLAFRQSYDFFRLSASFETGCVIPAKDRKGRPSLTAGVNITMCGMMISIMRMIELSISVDHRLQSGGWGR
jgi:hypothetical protein